MVVYEYACAPATSAALKTTDEEAVRGNFDKDVPDLPTLGIQSLVLYCFLFLEAGLTSIYHISGAFSRTDPMD
jgi:hypothetical protein